MTKQINFDEEELTDYEKEYISISQGDHELIPSGSVVDLGFCGPCTGIVIYGKDSKKAYAGHFADCEIEGLEKMILKSSREIGEIGELQVYVTGCSSSNEDLPEIREYDESRRLFVPEILSKYGFSKSQTYLKWSPENCISRFWFDVANGENELSIKKESGENIYQGNILNFEDYEK